MDVSLFTDASVQRRGFTATYKQVTCGASVTATTTPQTFTSPNHPNNYPNNAHCFWNFHTTGGGQVQVTFTTVHTEDCCDFVEVGGILGSNPSQGWRTRDPGFESRS
ncbi:CUB domain-containing protein 2-like [Ciona intestinalis]